MNLVIDGSAFERTWQRGIQRYFYELLSRTPTDVVGKMFFRKIPVAPVPSALRLTELKEQYLLSRRNVGGRVIAKARRLWFPTPYPQGDVFHSTYFTRSPHRGTPEVVTVHDMVPEVMPYFAEGNITHEIANKRECILAARKIIAISNSTATDLLVLYPEVSARIEVIHSGAQHFPVLHKDELDSRIYHDEPYVTFVGERRGYKNFGTLLDALTSLEWPEDLKLVVIGARFSESELLAIRFRGVERLIQLVVHPTDHEMRRILTKGRGFIFPSLIEGFGFPLVEAQALGVPVVASDTRIFREIGGEAFVRVKPLDPDSIARGVREVLKTDLRQRLIVLGLMNVKRFCWDECARQTVSVWRQVALER